LGGWRETGAAPDENRLGQYSIENRRITMSQRGEIWVHGNSAVLQFPGGAGLEFTSNRRMKNVDSVPWTDIVGLREGPGIRFVGQAGNSNWFHFSVPTPAIFPSPGVSNHVEITVDRVSVYYRTPNNQVFVNTILVFDGRNSRSVGRIGSAANLFGDHTTVFEEGYNAFLIDPLHLRLGSAHGVGISIEIQFDHEGEVFFKAAGIHFRIG
jgi:hypothetical protein